MAFRPMRRLATAFPVALTLALPAIAQRGGAATASASAAIPKGVDVRRPLHHHPACA